LPTLADNASTSSGTPSTSAAVSITPAADDILVVKAIGEDAATTGLNAPTDTAGNTWTLQASSIVASHTGVYVWTAVSVASSLTTITVAKTFGAGAFIFSMAAEAWRDADLPATPATAVATSSGAPTVTLTTTQDNSIVTWANGDWGANAPGSRVYNTTSATPVEEFVDDRSSSGTYVAYYAYQQAASAASQTIGITTPGSQAYALVGLEVLDVAIPGGEDPDQYDRQPWH
jgi:hypothetical protein